MKSTLDNPTAPIVSDLSGAGQLYPLTKVEMEIVDPLCVPRWDQLVLSHPHAHFFHSSAWARVLVKSYRHRPLYLQFSLAGRLLALFPLMEVTSALTGRRGTCLPFSDFCSPLLFDDCQPDLIVSRLTKLALERKWRHLELRGSLGLPSSITPAIAYLGHSLDLRQSENDLFAGFTSSVRRAIRKAEHAGVTTEISRTQASLMDFYRLHTRTRRRHGLPPQPLSFFHHIFDEVFQNEAGFVVRAISKSRCIAAAVLFQFGARALYKFGASDAAAQATRGNNLVMWEAIRFLVRRGCESLHLGRTSLDNDGLRRFKLSWGTQEELIRYFRWDTALCQWVGRRDQSRGKHNLVFAHMPLALNRLAGALLYRHLD